ncbi:MAG: PKD domain-containing protein, partial [Thermoplasmata archaeon]|nr:PKD domain-containing protein [Thermoplasmata archaeon]
FVSLTDDPAAGYVVLFGGWDQSSYTIFNDTWAYSHGTWTKLVTPVAPVPLRGAMVAYEAVGQYVLLFGGTTYSNPGWPFGLESQTWAFKAGNWTNLTPFITTEPSARFSAGVTNISVNGSIIMVDGCLGQGCPVNQDLSDTWLYNWTNINGTVSVLAPVRDTHHPATFSVKAIGGDFAYSYAYSGLPPGCVTANTPSLTCTPQSGGNYSVGVSVTDRAGHSMQIAVNLTIAGHPLALAVALSTQELDLGQGVVLTATASGGAGAPWSYSYKGLPEGCQSQNAGQLSCTPAQPGSYPVLTTATDAQGEMISSSASFIVHPAVQVTDQISSATIDLTQAVTVDAIASFGSSVYQYAWSNLPSGCSAGSTTTSISCTPTRSGTSAIGISATDSLGQVSQAPPILLTVNPLPMVTTSPLPIASTAPLTVTLVAAPTGGTGPFSVEWVFGDGRLGTGATVTHTYPAGGTYTPRVWVNDSFGFGASSSVLLNLHAPTTVSPPGHASTPSWTSTMFGQLSLGLLVGIVALALVG